MQFSAELLVLQLHDADVRHAERELELRREAADRATAATIDGAAGETSVLRRRRRHAAHAPRFALR